VRYRQTTDDEKTDDDRQHIVLKNLTVTVDQSHKLTKKNH